MFAFFYAMLGWLPLPLFLISCGVVAIFFIFTFLHIVRFLLDLIPFL